MLRSGSRGPILALIGVLAVWILSVSRYKVVGLLTLILFSSLVYIFKDSIFLLVEDVSPILYNRFDSRDIIMQTSDRDPLYEYAFQSFLSNPLIGENFAVYSNSPGGSFSYVHNIILETFMQLGLLGGIILIYVLIKTFIMIAGLIQYRVFYFWLGLLLIQQILKCMVSSSLYFTPIISILIILLFMPIEREDYDMKDRI